MGYRPRTAQRLPQEPYRPYESAVAHLLYEPEADRGTCVECRLDDTPLITTGGLNVTARCVWCAERCNVRFHRWQEAARMQRGYRWMKEHEALPERGYAVRALPKPPRGPAAVAPTGPAAVYPQPRLPDSGRPEWR